MGSFRPFGLIIGVLLSLFICPGTGHRYLGRIRAGKIVFWSFIVAFLILAVAMYSVVQDTVARLQETGQKIDLQNPGPQIREIILNAGGAVLALGLLILIYFLAPIELVVYEIWRAVMGYPIDVSPPATNPAPHPDIQPPGGTPPSPG